MDSRVDPAVAKWRYLVVFLILWLVLPIVPLFNAGGWFVGAFVAFVWGAVWIGLLVVGVAVFFFWRYAARTTARTIQRQREGS